MLLAGDELFVLPGAHCELPVGDCGGGSVYLGAMDSERSKLTQGTLMYAW